MLTPPEDMDEKHFDTFDIITAMEVIEHVKNKEVFERALGGYSYHPWIKR